MEGAPSPASGPARAGDWARPGWTPVLWAVLRRPSLWTTAMLTAWRLRRDRWWASPPHLPVPAVDYLRFRMTTAYGDGDAVPVAADVVSYLHWCRAWPVVGT